MSGTAHDCLVPRMAVWYRVWLSGTVAWLSGTGCPTLPFVLLFIYVSNYDITTHSAMFPATSEGCRDVKGNITGIFLFKMHISMRYEKNNQVPVLNPDRQISVSGDTMSHPSLYRLNWHLWHRITLDWDTFDSLDPTLVLLLINYKSTIMLTWHRKYPTLSFPQLAANIRGVCPLWFFTLTLTDGKTDFPSCSPDRGSIRHFHSHS